MASEKITKIVDEVAELSVLELSELVKEVEERLLAASSLYLFISFATRFFEPIMNISRVPDMPVRIWKNT